MRCCRCRGLMVLDRFTDLLSDTGSLHFPGLRCLNCGEVVDPVVIAHRLERPITPSSERA